MPKTDNLAWTSLALSLTIGLIALLLGYRQWWEHKRRDPDLPGFERKYFLFQDLRRGVGILLLAVLAPGIYVGSRLPIFVSDPPPPDAASADSIVVDRNPPAPKLHPNRHFLIVWLAIFATVAVVLGLALIDWIATRRYAHRHRKALSLERLEILRQTRQKADSGQKGPVNGSIDP
jgi:hypothetical protein